MECGRRRPLLVSALLGMVALLGVAAMAAPARGAVAPAPVPCSYIGSAEYNCYFYPAGDGYTGGAPVQAEDGSRVGFLNQGYNWVICQATGARVGTATVYNDWWAWTEADNGRWGWVNAYYGRGGDNDGPFQGAPGCDSSRGYPPGGSPPASPPPASVSPPPAPVTVPTPVKQPLPAPRRGRLHARFVLAWTWDRGRTRLDRIRVFRLPRGGSIQVRCSGRGCPRAAVRAVYRSPRALSRTLGGKRFSAGDRVKVTARAPKRAAERILLRIRYGAVPSARLLRR